MSKNNVQRLGGRSLFLLALCAGVCLGLPGRAAEKGTMKGLGVLVTIKQDTYRWRTRPTTQSYMPRWMGST
jgi:hypothetical protein